MSLRFSKNLCSIFIAAVAVIGILCVLGGSAFASTIPAQGAVRPDGQRVYVPDITNQRLLIVDSNNTTQRIITGLGGYPMGMAVALKPDGTTKLYVAIDKGSNSTVLVFNIGSYGSPSDPTSASATITISGTSAPKHVVASPSGDKVYVADSAGYIRVINTSTDTLDSSISVGATGLYGIAVKSDGSRLYVSQRASSGSVFVYNIANGTPTYVTSISGLAYPTYLAVAGNTLTNDLYLYVKVYETSGTFYDVKRYSIGASDSYTNDANISVVAADQTDSANPYEGIALSPNGDYIYVSHWRSLTPNGVRVYRYQYSNLGSYTNMQYVLVSKDFLGANPDGLALWANHSGNGDQDHQKLTSNTGYTGSGIPYPPRFTSPLKGDSVTGGNATWNASTGGSGSYTYYIQYIAASSIGSNNWSSEVSVSSPYALTSLLSSNGDYYLRIRSKDTNNVYSPYAYTGPFTYNVLDTTAPAVTVNTPSASGIILRGGQTYGITWTASDNVTPSANIGINLYYATNGTWTKINTSTETNDGTYTWTVPGIDSATVKVKVEATDNAGNTGSDVSDNNFTIDSTSPVADITSPLSNATVSGAVTISGTASDNLSFSQYVLEYGAGAIPSSWTNITTGTSPVTSGTLGTWETTGLNNGAYTIRLTVSDSAGNLDSTDTVTVNVNNIRIKSVDPNESNHGSNVRLYVTITGEATNFVQGKTAAYFGAGISVNSTRVVSPTLAVADITIAHLTFTGPVDVTVITTPEAGPVEVAKLLNGFNITNKMITVSPGMYTLGNTITVTIESDSDTHFQTAGVPEVHFFYPVGSLTDDPRFHVSNIVVSSDKSLRFQLTLDPTVEVDHYRDVQVKTGHESVTNRYGFTALVATVIGWGATYDRGSTYPVTVSGASTHFAQGLPGTLPAITFYLAGTSTPDPNITASNISVTNDLTFTFDMNVTSSAVTGTREVVVRTVNEVATGANAFRVTSAVTLPNVTNLTATPGNQQIRLDWTDAVGASGVMIRYKTTNAPFTGPTDGTLVANVPQTTQTYTHTPLTNWSHYYYGVFANYSGGNYATGAFTDAVPSVNITNLTATPGNQQITLNWTDAVGASGVMIRYKTTSAPFTGPADGTLVTDVPQTTQTYTHTSLTNGNVYYYGLFAHNAVPNYASGAFINATPRSLQGIIDDYENTTVIWPTGYYPFGNGITRNGPVSGSFNGTNRFSVRYSYAGAPSWGGGWGGSLNDPNYDIGIGGRNAIVFWVYGDNSGNTYHFEITMSNSVHAVDTVYKSGNFTMPATQEGWVPVKILYSALSLATGEGQATFNLEPAKLIKSYQFVYNGHNTSSTSHYIENVMAVVSDTLAPNPITDLNVQKSGNDTVLTWSPASDNPGGSGVAMYDVYRSASPSGPFVLIGTAGTTGYTDTGAASGTTDYYYVVKPVDNQGNAASNSNMGYKLISVYQLTGAHTFWVSIPYFNNFTNARSVVDYLNNGTAPGTVTAVSRFNPSSQAWESLVWSPTLGWQGTNFNIVAGEGLEIRTNAVTPIPIVGAFDPSYPPLSWSAGDQFISIPYSATYANALAIVNDINAGGNPATKCSKITRLNPSTGAYEELRWSAVLGWQGTNFTFTPGEAYRIKINGATTWSPDVY